MSSGRRKVAVFILSLVILSTLGLVYQKIRANGKPANLVLLLVDALRADHLSCYGYSRKTTPSIDRIAENAVICTNAYSQSNWTCPAMASLFTGTYPFVHKVYNDPATIKDRFSVIPPGLTVIPEALIGRGFETAAFTACGWVSQNSNFDRGFDEFRLLERSDRIILEQAEKFVRGKGQKKFFLYVHLLDVHDYFFLKRSQGKFLKSAYSLSENLKALPGKDPAEIYSFLGNIRGKEDLSREDLDYLIDHYDSALYRLDELVGHFIKTLENEKLLKKTVIIITADHGERFLEQGELTHGGFSLDNKVIRVPLIIHSQKLFPKSVERRELVETIDIFPTVIDLFDLEEIRSSDLSQLQGQSIMNPIWAKAVMAENSARDRIKVIWRNWSYVYHFINNSRELYDLSQDPGETCNVFEQHKIVAKKIHRAMLKKINDSLELSQKIVPEDAKINDHVRETLKSLGYIH
jgi:arylsulfatase A-like enzyme